MLLRRRTAGHYSTSATYQFTLTESDDERSVKVPAEYFCSPQFQYNEQPRFPLNPRQLQVHLMVPHGFYPFPMELPALSEEQATALKFLNKSVKMGNTYVDKATFHQRFQGAISSDQDHCSEKPGACTVKHVFHRDHCLEPQQSLKRFNEKFNRGVTSREFNDYVAPRYVQSDCELLPLNNSDELNSEKDEKGAKGGVKFDKTVIAITSGSSPIGPGLASLSSGVL